MRIFRSSLVCLTAAPLFLASPAHADDGEEALEPFRECGTITEGPARLACFDAALAGADAALEARQERRRRRTVEDFGLSATQIEERYDREVERARESGGDAEDVADLAPPEPTEVTSNIVETFTDSTRRRVFLLENGQMWREGSNSSLRGRIRVGSSATISRGGIGGYRLRVEGRTGFISVSRIR
ncbi:hypothetical protein [Parasphingopyxis sp.]|uniref:hypothetical protein n=1 Tax=Parasphingopyxis sp. TaxID=1920299 RepID=UPI00260D0EEC|nr:hypothetical protein [Parasphingopyxis sp.]